MASISRCFCSTSKKPPQVAGALLDILDVIESLGSDHVGKVKRSSRQTRTARARENFFLRGRARPARAGLTTLAPGAVRFDARRRVG